MWNESIYAQQLLHLKLISINTLKMHAYHHHHHNHLREVIEIYNIFSMSDAHVSSLRDGQQEDSLLW